MSGFPPVAAHPYAFPFDGRWHAGDTALLLLGQAPPLAPALRLRDAARAAGLMVLEIATATDNAFLAGRLGPALAGRRNLIFTGCPTEGIIHATMRAANDAGHECLLVEDACASGTPGFHDAILRITTFGNGLFGTVATAARVLAALQKEPMP